MNILSLLTYTSGIIYILFAIYILLLDRKDRINQIFFILSLSLATWSIADSFYYTAPTKDTAMTFWKISTLGWITSPALMLHLMILIGKFYRYIKHPFTILIIYLPALLFEYLALTTRFYLKDIFLTKFGWADLVDPELIITKAFLIYYLGYTLAGLILILIRGMKTDDLNEKKQLAIIFISSLLSLLPSFFTNTLQIAFGEEFQIPSFAEVFILIWVAGIMYSIKKYDFLTNQKKIISLTERIELEQQIVSIQNKHIKNLHYLSNTLIDFIRLDDEEDIYEFIADRIYLLNKFKLLMITSFDEEKKEFILKSIKGENNLLSDLLQILNKRPISVGSAIGESPIYSKMITSKLTKIEGGLYEAMQGVIDKNTIEEVHRKYLLGETYVAGFSANNRLLGGITIVLNRNDEIGDIEFFEVLINEASLILQKRLLDQKIARSESLYRTIFEQSADVIYILNGEGNILSINPSLERITGYKVSDLLGRSMKDILHPQDIKTALEMLNQVITGESFQRQTLRILDKSGRILYGEFIGRRFRLENGEYGLLGIGRDVTERIKNEEIIRSYQRELELKTTRIETVGLMATGVLHDLNNILMTITSKIENMRTISAGNPEILKNIDDIAKILTTAYKISRDLFDISGGNPAENKKQETSELILTNLNLLTRDKKYRLKADIPDRLPPLEISHNHLIQVLNNLVINAIQAMPAGGDIDFKLDIHSTADKDYIKVKIKDSGSGIPDDLQKRVFEPFFTTKKNGTGLGLYTVKSILNSAGGDIQIMSKPHQGTEVILLIPIKRTDNTKNSTNIATTNQPNASFIRNILVIDDDPSIREIATDILTHLGFNPVSVSDSRAAVKLIGERKDREKIDAAILDLHLQDNENSVDILKKIKAIDKNIKVIICSGSPGDPILTRYTTYGFDAALSKPFRIEDLKKALT